MGNNKTERVIKLNFYDPCCITAEEYEQIQKDLLARQFVGDTQPGDYILATVLQNMAHRYHEIRILEKHDACVD